MEIKKATRSGIIPLVGFFGKSGSGKTFSALMLARGLAGPQGRIVLIDTEKRRGSIFADLIPGGYETIELDEPFSPDHYTEALELAEKNAQCIVVDSLSHEHAGEGGVLDMQEAELTRMAGDEWKKREACKMAAWIKPKFAHKKFLARLLRCRVPLICCLRGEEKTHMVKGENGQKGKVVTDEFSTPIFDPRFLFELLICLETVAFDGQGGYVIPRKITHPAVGPLLPHPNEQITVGHGEAIARWASGGAAASPQRPPDTAKARLWAWAKPIYKTAEKFEAWLWEEGILSDTETLAGLSEDRLSEVYGRVAK